MSKLKLSKGGLGFENRLFKGKLKKKTIFTHCKFGVSFVNKRKMKFRMKRYIVFILICVLAVFNLNGQKRIERKDYIDKYKDMAIREMKRTGIPASITLAQGILESDNGNSTLARKGNNHFGIKCHKSWKGKRMIHDDDRKNECFRKYKSAEQSFVDHSSFLTSGQRYAFLFKLKPTDYKGWAHGLKKAGYATSRTYGKDLVRLIEQNELYQYDSKRRTKAKKEKTKSAEVAKDWEHGHGFEIAWGKHKVEINNRVEFIKVRKGDTFYSLGKELEMMQWEFYKYNGLPEDYILQTGARLYLQPKRRKAARGYEIHLVEEGETLMDISQKYAVRIKSILKYNNLPENANIVAGEKIHLRRKKK